MHANFNNIFTHENIMAEEVMKNINQVFKDSSLAQYAA